MTDQLEEGQQLAPEPPAKAPKKTGAQGEMTQYVLLSLEKGNDMWLHRGGESARSAAQAVRVFAEATGLTEAATLVAIPERSWRPVTVKPQTVTTLVIEEAS